MFTNFWDKIAENLAGEWQAQMSAPALAFWGGGLILYCARNGWDGLTNLIASWNSAQGIAALVAAFVLIILSTALMNQFSMMLKRWLEGYWRGPFGALANIRIQVIKKKIDKNEERWNWLAKRKISGEINTRQLQEYALLDYKLGNFPVDHNWLMPTVLGNLMRAAEEHPLNHYGLEINITWPRLWLLLPEDAKKEVSRSRNQLDQAVQIFSWALLFCVWSIWNPWAAIIGLLLAILFYQAVIQAAGAFGQILKSVYDLYRFSLYENLHWPIPTSPADEISHGKDLTNYLHRAEAGKKIKFKFPEPPDKK